MGCSDCNRKGGCDTRKGEQRGVFDEIVARVYPTRTWGLPDDEARFGAGVRRGEARRIGRALAEHLRAPTFFRDGAADDLASFVYVLCLGREPALVDVRDGLATLDAGLDVLGGDGETAPLVRERYLRVALSTVARVGAIQEVEMTLERDGDGGSIVREAPRAGVYEPSLLKRVRAATSLLGASDVLYADFGLLDRPVEDSHPGDYAARYGVEPRLVNFLFYAAPATTAIATRVA